MPIIPGIIASELSGNLQPQPPIIDTISGAVVISGGTTSGSNSIVQVFLTPNPLGQPLTSYGVTAFSGSPLVAISGSTVTGSTSPLTITYPFAANALYEFAGFANNKYGNSKYGNISNQVEPFLATATPSGLAVIATSVSGATFTFLQVPGSTNYVLSAVGSFTDNAGLTTNDSATLNVAGPGTSPTVTGIMNHGFFTGMPYKFYVQSQNFAGTSASGANITLTPNPFAAPTVTPIFTAIASGNNSKINVTITNPDTNPLHNLPTRYIYADANNGFSSTSQSATTATLSGLTNPIEPVAIINVTAQGAYGGTPGTPQTLLFPPATPTITLVNVSTPATGWTNTSATATVNVTWSQSVNTQYSQPTSYTVTASAVGYPSVTSTSSTTSILLTGTFYYNVDYTISVTATNAGGTSSAGTAGSTVRPYAVAAPGDVTSVTATVVNSGSVNLSWSAPSSGGPYSTFYISDNQGLQSTTVASGTTSKTINASYALNTSYTFSVYVSNVVGSGGTGTSSAVTPYSLAVPGAVTSMNGTIINTGEVDLTWTNPTTGGAIASIDVYTVPATTIYNISASSTSYNFVDTFAKGTSYTFYAVPKNAAGSTTPSSTFTALPNPKPTVNATNATHYSDANYDYAVWRTTGTLSITTVYLNNVEILAVGAGGGGGAYRTISTGVYAGGGGGGAGQILAQSYGTLGTTPINVTIGAGGTGGSGANGGLGGSSSLIYNSSPYTNLFTVNGGGGGGFNAAGSPGANGGGGAGNTKSGGAGQTASQGQSNGYSGGAGYQSGSQYYAGGGGGAFQDGQSGNTNSNGGAGLQFSDWSSATSTGATGYYAGGGGGAGSTNSSGSWGNGGAGGGGTGASLATNATQATAGTANTGGGGGGAAGPSYSTAGAGGSGLIILRWPLGTANIGF